jgi:predicted transcriptional regulator
MTSGINSRMKTAVSIPTDLFRRADRLAKRLKKSRSALYAAAVREYVAHHDPKAITAAVNAWIDRYGDPIDHGLIAHSKDMLRRIEW